MVWFTITAERWENGNEVALEDIVQPIRSFVGALMDGLRNDQDDQNEADAHHPNGAGIQGWIDGRVRSMPLPRATQKYLQEWTSILARSVEEYRPHATRSFGWYGGSHPIVHIVGMSPNYAFIKR